MQSLRLVFSLLGLAFLISCSPGAGPAQNADLSPAHRNGIIGGQQATSQDLATASTVSLITSFQGRPFSMCTGTLISRNLVLTATHCLKNQNIRQMFVYFGETLPDSFQDSHLVKIKSTKIHPDYRFDTSKELNVDTGYNDVGLIVLDRDAPAPFHQVPVLNDTVLAPGQILLLAGFGLLEETPNQINAPGLFQTRVSLYRSFENMLVTDQTHANGACAGDSGGPAYLETSVGLVVLGITRGPHDRAKDCRHYGEYTYASRFKDYILQSAAELQAELPVFVDAPAFEN